MTEKEARKKWCPLVRCAWYPTQVPKATISGWNRIAGNVNCIASSCMKWPECESLWDKVKEEKK
jgi:hypothetical protein